MLFLVGLSFLLTHEMDAVRHHEWRLFIGLRSLNEERAYRCFTALHVPLYSVLFWGALHSEAVILALDAFFVVHLLLHIWFRHHPRYTFHSFFSWSLIVGAAIAGTVDALLRVL